MPDGKENQKEKKGRKEKKGKKKEKGEPFLVHGKRRISEADPKIVRKSRLMHLMHFVDLINLLSIHPQSRRPVSLVLSFARLHPSPRLTIKHTASAQTFDL